MTSELTNYNRWIVATLEGLLLQPLSGSILEFGCGTGGVTRALAALPRVEKIFANDISAQVASFFQSSRMPKKIHFIGDDLTANHSLLSELKYDFAVTTNTLEHIQKDGEALRLITEGALKKCSLVLVPAFECLFGTCDRDGGHIRRYTRRSFVEMCENNDLRVERIRYVNMVGAMAWWTKYVFRQQTDYCSQKHGNTYSFFDKRVLPLTSKIEHRLGAPFGLSVVAKVSSLK